MTLKERVKEFSAYKRITIAQFERESGLSNGYFNQVTSAPRKDKLSKIQAAFPDLNREWLLYGEGEMLKEQNIAAPTEQGIPFYDMDVTASIAESFSDIREDAQYYINYPPLNDCSAAFPVYGDSMVPDFYPGEVVLVREITNVNSMLWGEPYLVVTDAYCDNLRTIKNVFLSDDRNDFVLRATNPKFSGDTVIPRDHVLKIFLVKGKVNRRQL